MDAIQSHSASNMVSFTQPAAVAALKGPQDVVDQMVSEFDRRRRHIVERLNAVEGITCAVPGGAFYVFPNVSALYGRAFRGAPIAGSDAFTDYLLSEANVAVVAGSGFGADDYVRISYATSMELIDKGIDRIQQAVSRLE